MIDLSRRLAQNTYHKKYNPSGIVDLGSAKNELMIDELQTWLARHDDEKDKADCKAAPSPPGQRPPCRGPGADQLCLAS